MSQMWGADPESLDALATQFRALAERLDDTRASVGTAVAQSPWRGESADRFRYEWNAQYARLLSGVAAAVVEAEQVIHANANQQRAASGESTVAYGGGGGIGGLLHVADGAVNALKGDARSDLGHLWHSAESAALAVGRVESDVVSSRAFADTMGVIRVVGTVASVAAPFLLWVPVVGEVVAGVALVANSAVLVGDALQMANTGDWDAMKLGGDALAVAGGMAGVAASGAVRAGTLAMEAGDVDGVVSNLQMLDDAQQAQKFVTSINQATDLGQSAEDFSHGKDADGMWDLAQAAGDGADGAHDGASGAVQLLHTDADLAHDAAHHMSLGDSFAEEGRP